MVFRDLLMLFCFIFGFHEIIVQLFQDAAEISKLQWWLQAEKL